MSDKSGNFVVTIRGAGNTIKTAKRHYDVQS